MQISELIATLHHEVAKGYAFIAEIKGGEDKESTVLHINIERLEIELPVILSQQEVKFNPKDVIGQPVAFKKLSVPFSPKKDSIPKKTVTGKAVMAQIVGPIEKVDDRVSSESIGRIKIAFKLVLS